MFLIRGMEDGRKFYSLSFCMRRNLGSSCGHGGSMWMGKDEGEEGTKKEEYKNIHYFTLLSRAILTTKSLIYSIRNF